MRRLLKFLAVFIVLVVLAAGALLALLPTSQIVEIAADQVRAATGRELKISGDVSPSFYPVLGVEAQGVSLSNAEGGLAENMVTADAVKVGVELLPLISGDIRVTEIRLEQPVVSLEVDETGRGNWVFGDAEEASGDQGGGLPQNLSLGETTLAGGAVRYIDRRTGEEIALEDINAEIWLNAVSQPMRIRGDAVWNGEKSALDLTVITLESLLGGGETRVDFALSDGPVDLAFDGAVIPPSDGGAAEANGAYKLSVADPARASAWATGSAAEGLAGLSDARLEGRIAVDALAISVTATGGLTRDGKRLLIDMEAAGADDWASKRAFDLTAELDLDGLMSATYSGVVSAPEGADPALDGALKVTGDNPAAALAWATGAPADGLEGLSGLDIGGDVALSPGAATVALKGGVSRDGKRLTADLKAKGGAGWMRTRAFDVALEAGAKGLGAVSYTGSVAAPAGGAPAADGLIDIDAPDLRALAGFAGVALPDGNPDAFRSFALNGAVATPQPGVIRIRAGALDLDAIRARGEIVVGTGAPMTLNATLTAGMMNLDPYINEGETPEGPGWSREPIDLTALGALNGDFSIRAKGVKMRQIELGASDITARLRGGKLNLGIRELGLYGGGVKGDVALDGAHGNAMTAKISASAVRLRPLLKAFADVDMIEGLGALTLDVTSKGDSLHDIMNALNGSGALKLTDGAVVGYDIAGMVRNVASAFGGGGGDQRTEFSEVSGTFNIVNGLLSNADFQFLGPLLRIVGEGKINLAGQSMDFRLVPKAVASLKGQGGDIGASGLAFPLLVTGPWNNLSITPDLQAGIGDLLKNPEAAIGAMKSISGAATGDIGGAAQEAIGAAAGAGIGGAAAVMKQMMNPGGAEAPAPAPAETRDFKAEIKAAKAELEAARAAGDKKRIKAARAELKKLRAERDAAKQGAAQTPQNPMTNMLGGMLKAMPKP